MEKKSIFKTIKEYWKIPRYHGLISLGLYFLFFMLIYLLTQPLSGTAPTKDTDYNLTTPYTVEYTFKEINRTEEIDHRFQLTVADYSKILTYKNTGDTYNIIDGQLIGNGVEINEILPVSIVGVLPETIMVFLQDKIPVSNGTYQDGTTKKEYEAKASELAVFASTNQNYILITTYSKNNKLEKIVLDITKALEDPTIMSYNIEFIYQS